MEPLICPSCGKENSPDSSFCSNCRSALITSVDVENPPPSYPEPVQAKKGIAGMSNGKKIAIAIAVFLALALSAFIGYRVIENATYPDLELDTPPAGYEQVTGAQFEDLARQFEVEGGEGSSLDAFYLAGDGTEQIFIAHVSSGNVTLISFGNSDNPPETEDLAEMKAYVNRNRSQIEQELEKGYSQVSADAETALIEAAQLEKDGFCCIRISTSMTVGEITLVQDRLVFYRDGVTYVAAVQNTSGASNDDGMQYLLENLYFE